MVVNNPEEEKVKSYRGKDNPLKLFGEHLTSIGTGVKYLVKPTRITLMYPEETMKLPVGYRGMIRLYKDVCIGCSLCAMVCPADAMKMTTEGGKKLPSINYGRCVYCAYCVDICPVDALKETGVHDAVFTSRKELLFDPEKFNKDFDQPLDIGKPVKRVRAKIDENKGISYEPVE